MYKKIVCTTPWWQNQSTGRSMGSFNPSYALHSLQYTSSSIGSLPSQTVTFSRLKSSAIKAIVFASWKSIVWVLTSGVFSVIRLSERGEQIPKKKLVGVLSLLSTQKHAKVFFGQTWSLASNSRYARESIFQDPGYPQFPGIKWCDLPPSFILASVCSSRRCYKRLNHGLDSFPFFSRSLELFLRNALRILCKAKGNYCLRLVACVLSLGVLWSKQYPSAVCVSVSGQHVYLVDLALLVLLRSYPGVFRHEA